MNSNETQEKAKEGAIKSLAIIGFIAIVVLAVWLTVQIVRVLPGAFSSLASVMDSIQSNRPIDTLSVATEKSIVNTGESVSVSWTDLNREGTYGFYYTCTEGVSVEVRTTGGETTEIACGSALDLPLGSESLDMIISSERRRFIDVPFTVTFTGINETEPLFERNSKVTVVNATIPQSVEVAEENGEATEEETADDEETATPTTGVTGGSQVATPIESTVSFIPQSHEDGFTDLKMTYLGVGTLENNIFTPAATIDQDERGAIRFEVKNIGTKTSEKWTFEATLPTGYVFHSDEQMGLKPNERAVFTLGFDPSSTEGTRTIGAELEVDEDTNANNNAFTWSVAVTD